MSTTVASCSFLLQVLVLFGLATSGARAVDSSVEGQDTSALDPIEILLKLYDDTRGYRWTDHEGWLVGNDYCSWKGVTCFDEADPERGGHVQKLELKENHLFGTLPSDIFALPYLETLMLRDNQDLTVRLDNLGAAQHLKDLIVTSTNTESIEGVSAVKDTLEELHITDLQLDGPIPEEVFAMTNLKALYANFNNFQGPLPTLIGKLRELEDLYLMGNSLSDAIPSELGLLTKLQVLGLANNDWTGRIPTEFGELTNLEILSIQREPEKVKSQGVNGPLPAFDRLSKLTELYLQGNLLDGPMPNNFLASAPQVEVVLIYLSDNSISGTVPDSLSHLQHLKLYLDNNAITGVSTTLCGEISGWMSGLVGDLPGCSAFLCPPDTYATEGRATETETCRSCVGNEFFGSTQCAQGDQETDVNTREVLIEMYNTMGGRFWKNNDNWLNPGRPFCEWHGIVCDNDGDYVTGINMKDNDLEGSFPSSIFSLEKLASINLSGNSIDFSFTGVGAAKLLEFLDLTHTDLTSIEGIESLSQTSIKRLKLTSNYLQGSIPTTLFQLVTLEELSFSHNRFDGVLPTQVGNLSNLQRLKMYGNKIGGELPSQLGLLTNLVELDLSENLFRGSLPTELNELVKLEIFSLHQTSPGNSGLTGSLLSFQDLTQLTSLQLDSNSLDGNLPSNFLVNTQVGDERIEVRLSDNEFSGSVPSSWETRFDNLFLDLSGNEITGIPSDLCEKEDWMDGLVQEFGCDALLCPKSSFNEFGRQTDATSVCRPCNADSESHLGRKACTEEDMDETDLTILKEFYYATGGAGWTDNSGWIDTNDYCGWVGVECNENDEVTKLSLPNNGLSGTPPSSVFDLSKLVELDLQENMIDFRFDGIGRASRLRTLHLSNTNLDSVNGISDSNSLESLHLTQNELGGPIPAEMFDLTSLKKLFMNYNQFTGRLPNHISKWTNLEELYLLHNRLDGQIPAAIGSMTSLRVLSLSENALTGTIPPELGDLENIEILAIQREDGTAAFASSSTETGMDLQQATGSGLRGALPSFDRLKYIQELYLGENSLEGTIPVNFLDGVLDKTREITVDLVSNQMEGGIPAALTQFDKMKLYVADNKIENIADGICQKDDWMGGELGSVGCDALLCRPGTANRFGREHSGGLTCQNCASAEDAPFYGMFQCLSDDDHVVNVERNILRDFFETTQGRQWQTNNGWETDEDICQWYGITCTQTDPPSVSAIHLANNGLSGGVSTNLWMLPNLTELNVAGNNIVVTLETVGDSKLEYLNLDNTGISSLDSLSSSNLKLLHITDNRFESFPTQILDLPNLEVLFLSNNEIEELPDSVGTMSNLRFLACDECGLKGELPLWLTTGLTNLEYIALRQNAFVGSIPDMTALTVLKHLDIGAQRPHGGGLTGQVSDFATLTKLVELFLDGNKLTGPIPNAFLQNVADTELITVDLRSNQINGSVPETLAARFTKMNLLLGGNLITNVPQAVCAKDWNGGKVDSSSCDHILCSAGTYSIDGHASPTVACETCPDLGTSYLGSMSCGDGVERATLETMFLDLGSTAWTNHDNWGTTPDVCSWYGIECHDDDGSDASGKVQTIRLENNNLEGTLKSSIYQLPYLEEIYVKQNDIDIEFDGISTAPRLAILHVSQTRVKSVAGIGGATGLKALHLTGNEMTGSIPPELFRLTKLESLYLNYNQYDGTLSTQISELSNLKEFYLFHNRLTGTIPTQLGVLTDMEVLGLGENGFHGTIPTELFDLEELRVLSLQKERGDFSTDGITGTLPNFHKLELLRELYLGGNNIGGSIPSDFLLGIFQRRETITVDLVDNQITGEVPGALDVFGDLRLYLAGNQISSVPSKICDMSEWMDGLLATTCDAFLCPPGTFNEYGRVISEDSECFPCSVEEDSKYYGSTSCGADAGEEVDERTVLFQLYNELDGNSWSSRDNWKEDDESVCDWFGVKCDGGTVVAIELPRNSLKGTVPPSIFHLKSLRKLNLQENDVEFTFEGIGLTPALEELNMAFTKARSLSGIEQLENLRSLTMAENHFSSSLPRDIFRLSNLEKLFMTNAGFTGPIPTSIGAMTKLSVLFMNNNEFTGTLPSEMGQLTSVSVLQLSENLVYGSIPTEVNNMKALKSFFADSFTRPGAGFSGPLPAFDGLPNLRELALGSNTFTGTIPSAFLSGITVTDAKITIGLHANQLTGAVPSTLTRFDLVSLDVAANRITSLPDAFCSKSNWNEGKVGEFGCDALLCPAGTYNDVGKQEGEDSPCLTCQNLPSAELYLGSTGCLADQKKQEKQVLEKFFQSTSGLKWKDMTGWLSDNDICSWYGVSCTTAGTVESLLLGSNNLHGTVPADIFGGLPDLMYLWLYSNPVAFSFDKIGQAKKLNSLLIDSTGLVSLDGIGSATALTDLDVRFNNLEGTVPAEIANLRDLSSFACGNNQLEGTIPSFKGNRKLKTLRMGSNQFEGKLPDFATSAELETVDVSQNRLMGSVPVSLLANTDTENEIFIDLSDNRLTGTIPGELTRFDKVRLFLRDNMFSGIDTGLCGKLDWLEGDVGTYGCNGIMCPPATYGPKTGRASTKDGGQQCLSCPREVYFGSTTCGEHTSASSLRRSTRTAVTLFAAVLSTAVLLVL